MFCSYCGKEIAATSRFCSFCGSAVAGAVRNPGAIQQNFEPKPFVQPAQTVQPVETPAQTVVTELPKDPAAELTAPAAETLSTAEEPIAPIAPTLDEQQISLDITTQLPSFDVQNSTPEPQAQIPEQPTYAATQTPSVEPQNTAEEFNSQIPQQQTFSATQPQILTPQTQIAAPQNNLPERKYTAAHLIMCLASTAVFAIAAGVFAGLYFAGL